jgi:peroxiredoxin Q/BCP
MKLKAGDKAPAINAVDQFGNKISLEDYSGSKVILYFYPKDDTPGCTAEACNLRDNYSQLIEKGYKIIGVSADSTKAHLKFTEKYALPFPLIPDTDKKIVQDYGVWGKKKFMGREYDGINRTTFVISEDGHILSVIEKVDTKDHANQVLSEKNNS